MKRDLYAETTSRILAELKAGTLPWVKPWSQTAGMNVPHNAATGRPYSGINVIMLWMAAQATGYATPRYLTFKQAKELGGHVKAGEHGHKVFFYKQLEVKDKNAAPESDATRMVPLLREYTVFNIDQCADLPARVVVPVSKAPRNSDARDPLIEDFLVDVGPTIRENAGEAYYVPGQDYINIPAFAAFKSAGDYYRILFHELGHWTGHKSRLDRTLKTNKGTADYALEELVADLTSAFLCAEFSIDGATRHADYIGHWIERLTHDPRAFFKAAAQAQKAADYLRGLALADNTEALAA